MIPPLFRLGESPLSIPEVYLARNLDAACIIALWISSYHADPKPQPVTAEAVAALTQYLRGAQYSSSSSPLEEQFASLGIQVVRRSERPIGAPAEASTNQSIEDPDPYRVREYCFRVGDITISARLPAFA